eukprot:TRINITY_DN67186_c9_g6_i3.p1 TRINITY_DN67186_c9_g6~~TRINITY_DN67186_c9_g6_i3.p1  ORF type:complete len:828 (+),score=7.56 TRINITY_DN67186_c9_g6_i3:46-2529(+)
MERNQSDLLSLGDAGRVNTLVISEPTLSPSVSGIGGSFRAPQDLKDRARRWSILFGKADGSPSMSRRSSRMSNRSAVSATSNLSGTRLDLSPPGHDFRSIASLADVLSLDPNEQVEDYSSGESLSSEVQAELRRAFDAMDTDKSGTVAATELRDMLIRLGEDPTRDDIQEFMALADTDGDGQLTFDEFKVIYERLLGNGLFERLNLDKLLAPTLLDDVDISQEDSDRIEQSIPVLERLAAWYLKLLLQRKAAKDNRKQAKEHGRIGGAATGLPTQNTALVTRVPMQRRMTLIHLPGADSLEQLSKHRAVPQWPPIVPLPTAIPGFVDGEWPEPVFDPESHPGSPHHSRPGSARVNVLPARIDSPTSARIRNPLTFLGNNNTSSDEFGHAPMYGGSLDVSKSNEMKSFNAADLNHSTFGLVDTEHTTAETHTKVVIDGTEHVFITRETVKRMRYVEWWCIIRASIAGLISALLSGLVEWRAGILYPGNETLPWQGNASTTDRVAYWSLVGGSLILFSVIEILFLYADALRSSLKTAAMAGLRLYPLNDDRAEVTRALSRTVLEMNHPDDEYMGIDPLKYTAKWRRVLALLVYKAKTGVTVFFARVILKRVVGRVAAKAALPFIGAPIIMIWNFFVSWKVMRQTRLLVIGPPLLLMLTDSLLSGHSFTYFMRRQFYRTCGVAIAKNAELHPNLMMLLKHLQWRLGVMRVGEILDDFAYFMSDLDICSPEEQLAVLKLLLLAFMVDGTLSERDKRLMEKALRACDFHPKISGLVKFSADFTAGRADTLTVKRLHDIFDDRLADGAEEEKEKPLVLWWREFRKWVVWILTV